MKRLDAPDFDHLRLFDVCVDEIDDVAQRDHWEANRHYITGAYAQFNQATINKNWCDLPRSRHGHSEDIVVGNVTKGQLKTLYEENVVRSQGKARRIYDDIFAINSGYCPYCADIGEVETLDHYLPKAYFPSYSVLPVNLVPSCNKCNKGIGQSFPANVCEQPLHPYLDDDHFFQERWVRASVHQTDPIEILFVVDPPQGWTDIDKTRVKNYFVNFDLQNRFSKQVPGELGPLIAQRTRTLRGLPESDFREHLNIVASDPNLLLNGWKRTLYAGLIESQWFCNFDFGQAVTL